MSLLNPLFAIPFLVGVSGALFAWAGRLQPSRRSRSRAGTYLCGEDMEPFSDEVDRRLQPDHGRLFGAAFLFTVMEVGALLAGLIPRGESRALVAMFLGVMFLGAWTLVAEVFSER